MKKIILSSILGFSLFGCTSTLLMDSSINDFLLLGIKTNSNDNVVLNFSSNVVDGKQVPFKKGKIPPSPGQIGFNHTESYSLNKMAQEYMSMRFLKFGQSDGVVVDLKLRDFWIEQGPIGSFAEQLLATTKFEVESHIDVVVTVTINGNTETKIIKTSHSEQVNGLAGAIWQKQISVCINKVNNKVLMVMSQFFESLNL